MSTTLGFDVYGTLIDTQGVLSTLETMIPDRANDFSKTWREKQLEYSFRRGLMQNYVNFSVCTSQALEYTCQLYDLPLTEAQKNKLLASYSTLPAFDDVAQGLAQLKEASFRLYAFSNGSRDAIDTLLNNAGIREFFDGVVSCDDIKSFKPNPAVYGHFMRQSDASCDSAWLVSSNPFDVIGARSAGMHAAWVQRSSSTIFDPWGIEPTVTIRGLDDLHDKLITSQ
ncbi:MAG: haloacid dehalogenase type II [Spongiibacteraceae bacterium]